MQNEILLNAISDCFIAQKKGSCKIFHQKGNCIHKQTIYQYLNHILEVCTMFNGLFLTALA